MQSRVLRTGAALLLLPLATACGGAGGASSTDGENSVDSGHSTDGGENANGEEAGDSGESAESGTPVDGGTPIEGGKNPDGGNAASTLAVNLGTAGNFVMLAKSGISTVPTSAITGDLGVSPAAAT